MLTAIIINLRLREFILFITGILRRRLSNGVNLWYGLIIIRPRGETDITSVFGTDIRGSNPLEGALRLLEDENTEIKTVILDVQLFHFFNSFAGQSRIFDALAVFLARYFQYPLIIIFLLFLYFSGYARPEKLRIFLITAVSSIVARFGITEIIRFFYHRPRPFLTFSVYQLLSSDNWSFPSGHSAFFFAMATAVYFYNKKWGIGFFIAATLMNMSRVAAGIHYPSDILGGAIIGAGIAYATFYFIEKRNRREIRKTL